MNSGIVGIFKLLRDKDIRILCLYVTNSLDGASYTVIGGSQHQFGTECFDKLFTFD